VLTVAFDSATGMSRLSGRDASARAGQIVGLSGAWQPRISPLLTSPVFATKGKTAILERRTLGHRASKKLRYPQIATFGSEQTLYVAAKRVRERQYMSPEVVPFARSAEDERDVNNQLDKAGQTILQLLGKAADVAEKNSRHAIDTAQQLSHQLRAAEDRISELEAEVIAYRDQAERAEQWLHRVYTEIEDRFLRQGGDQRGTPQLPQGAKRR
jgi:hypothetical protein